ncbi:MAG: response regulator transcription factor [Candidatus Obscuribacterales bacterium]|nr:response regulator transcription factor [Candidatus Obscuribacterales bacterium]
MTIKILLIEDHPVSRTGIKFLLSGVADFEVVGEGENGVQAVELARTLQPDVVLMDVAMPMMNGIDAARALLQENSGRAKVIMLTAYDSEQDIYASLTAGAHGYCLKDTDAERLCGAIRSVASGDIWLDAGIADKFLQGLKSAYPPKSSSTDAAPQDTSKKSASQLSARESEVLTLLVQGFSNQEIANRLVIGRETVKTHIRHIMEKLAVSDRTQAAVKALKEGLISS